MSVYVINFQGNAKHLLPVSSEEEFRTLRNSTSQIELINQARNGNQSAKRKLLQFNYSCLPNEDGTLKETTRLSNTVGMDIDLTESENEVEKSSHAIQHNILAKKDDLGLVMLERSVTKGYHIVFLRHSELTQEQNLRWASTLLGIEFDPKAKDHTRVFFSTTGSPDDLIYVHKHLFDNSTEYAIISSKQKECVASVNLNKNVDRGGATVYPLDFEGIPYPLLVECLADQLGGVPVHGSRNGFIFSMACHLRYVCNNDMDWITRVLPTYGEAFAKYNETVKSACNRNMGHVTPEVVKRAISVARSRMVSNELVNASTPPQMPQRLPGIIKLLVSKVDPMYAPAVAMGVFPALGAHLHNVRTRYIDNTINDLGGFMSVLLAKQSIGKGSINMPIECIMEDIRKHDIYNRDREKQWKEECNMSKDNTPARPSDLHVQYLMSNMTNAALVERLVDAEAAGNRFLYVKVDELEMLNQIKATGGVTTSELIRLSFTQSLYGQERVGSNSVTGTPHLRLNFNASSTVETGQSYFAKGLTNGTISRLTFSTIIKPISNSGIPLYGEYDDIFKHHLASYINNLNAASGIVECRQAKRMAEMLRQQNEELSELSDDDDFETLSYRANRIAFDKAMVLFIANGYRWTKSIADFCEWSERYDLWCKMHFFGRLMREKSQQSQTVSLPGVQNMLALLPDRFSREDLIAIRQAQGKDSNVNHAIAVWMNRGYIQQDQATLEYFKTELYKKKHTLGC